MSASFLRRIVGLEMNRMVGGVCCYFPLFHTTTISKNVITSKTLLHKLATCFFWLCPNFPNNIIEFLEIFLDPCKLSISLDYFAISLSGNRRQNGHTQSWMFRETKSPGILWPNLCEAGLTSSYQRLLVQTSKN